MGDYTFDEIYAIVVMQSFSGVSLMCIYILMGLGLYIIFGQMGVINRSFIGAREMSADLPEWLLGSWQASDIIDIPISGLVLLLLTIFLIVGLALFKTKTRMGLRMQATTQNREMTGALGINTKMTDRITFGIACGISGIAGAFFTTMASTSPSAGTNYIVDSFLVLVVGGLGSLVGLFVSGGFLALLSSILEFFMTGSIAKVWLYLVIFVVLMKFTRGLFVDKVRS